jgi:hypothetical protein
MLSIALFVVNLYQLEQILQALGLLVEFFDLQARRFETLSVKGRIRVVPFEHDLQFFELQGLHLGRIQEGFDLHVPVKSVF